jgi:uncharacterized protein YndB with AHSA1/START domain
MLKRIALVFLLVIVAVLGYAATLPDTFQIERSATINAPSEKIFPLINDFRQWRAWSPWENLDPALQRTFSGPESGVGAVYEWAGNKDIGKGRMEIIESSPSSKVGIALEFLEPFEAKNTTEFTLTPVENGTTVNWAMSGQNLYIGKVMSLFMNMDKLVGKTFEQGLSDLKKAAEQ